MLILGVAIASCTAPQGHTQTRGRKATVLLFVAPECPISNAYAPEFNRIDADYRGKGVALLAVHADPRVTQDAARQHAIEYGYHFPFQLDPDQKLARKTGITVTPEAAVLDADGDVVYVGRIDDLYVDLGKRRVAATKHDLRDAIDAVIAGRRVQRPAAPAVGCELPPGL
jgi:thiol-disulfide isomerase/thioredoxin